MVYTIIKDFGCVPCGVKTVDTVEFENNTKKAQVLKVNLENKEFKILSGAIQIHPSEVVAQPKQTVCFKLTYISNVEDIIENFSYNILDGETLVARLKIRAHSVGPSLEPTIFNVKFFRFRDVNQTVRRVQIANKTKEEAKFFFDIDEDYEHIQISQKLGVIPAGLKLGLTLTFVPQEPGVYYKKIFCIVQFHKPIIFNVLAVNKPKVRLDPKNIVFRYPSESNFSSSYEAFMHREEIENLPDVEKIPPLQKCLEDLELSDVTNTDDVDNEKQCWTLLPEASIRSACKNSGNIFLTTNYVDIENSPEVLKATSLINLSKSELYYYQWDHDPKNHFQIVPGKGFIKPNTKTDFAIYFTPSALDCLYHTETDVKIFLCNEESEPDNVTMFRCSLPLEFKLSGNICLGLHFLHITRCRFEFNSLEIPNLEILDCGWVPQCKISPKVLHLRACVPNETVYGCVMIEREGHLPVNFAVVPTKENHFSVQPPLGHLSENFRLVVVQFNNNSKEPGIYAEDLKFKFNNSDLNIETVKVITAVEIPWLVIGKDNSITFDPVFPGSKISNKVQIENPTSLVLSYEFKIPDDINWLQVVNPKGLVEPRGCSEVEVIFQPDVPCEYLDSIPCFVSSVSNMDYFETIKLKVFGSCQYGYLIATPNIHDFGQCVYLKEKSTEVHLFNFSHALLYFQLIVTSCSYPPGDLKDIMISPARGKVPAKGSLKLDVTIKPNRTGICEYVIECQNFKGDSDEPCDTPRQIIWLKFEGVLPYVKIIDVDIINGGTLFSSHWLWKMLSVDKINDALKSLKPTETLKIKLPEAVRQSPPPIIALMVESSKYEKIQVDINLQIQCPCYEASSRDLQDECSHKKKIFEHPSRYALNPSEKLLLLVKVNYDYTNERMVVMDINLPYGRKLILKMPLVPLPIDGPTCLSSYLDTNFTLKPVFIGDPQPPLQLFWLYNNTKEPSSYSVDMEALQKDDVHNVFDCINPVGVIQPFSSYPLAFVFRPTEMIKYSVEVPINLQKEHNPILNITGEGVLQLQPLQEIIIPKTVPEVPVIKKEDLECCENCINIPFIGVFSSIKRIFFIRNNSLSEKWAFQWSSFKIEDIFAVRIEPESGVVAPGQKALMTLFLRSFCHPTFISFSIYCTIYNYSQKMNSILAVRAQEAAAERSKDYFTITEKGISYEETEVKKPDLPKTHHIFITVNANILSHFRMEHILSQKWKYTLKADNEMKKASDFNFTLKPTMRQCIEGLLEKLLWEILCSRNVVEKIKNSQKSQDFIYRQILPESRKKKDELVRHLMASPDKRFVQSILEGAIREAVIKNFIPGESQENQDPI